MADNGNKDETKEEGVEEQSQKVSPRDHGAMMFAFDDQSPQESPRDRPTPATIHKPHSDTPNENGDKPVESPDKNTTQESPSNSPRPKKVRGPQDFLTQSSPPRFVSLEEIMKAADGVTNMTLAHEITVDNDFRFQKQEAPKNSLEQQVQDIMHKAFWDVLEEKLGEDPPDYSQALVLLEEVRENVLELMLPHHQRIRTQIEEVLDLDLIAQRADQGALDVRYYADFIIFIMSQLCAPVRDDDVAKLREISDIVPLFKAIFKQLDVLKLDMANFTIQQMRPYIQSQSITYEKTKFKQLLEQQQENGRDGLEFTKAWIHRAGELVCQQVAAQSPRLTTQSPGGATTQSPGVATTQSPGGATTQSPGGATTQSPGGATTQSTAAMVAPPGVSPAAILNTAYMELLQWDEDVVFPETLLMDRKRFLDLCEKMRWLGLVSSIVMVTYNTIGDPIAGVRTFKEKLKNDIAIIISGTPFEEVVTVMPSVGMQVVKEVRSCLQEHGYPSLSDDRAVLLQGLIESVASPTQPVHKCLRGRLLQHIQKLLSSPGTGQIQVPPGFAAMSEEFSHVYGQFLRLVTHNRAVFGSYYADIIGAFLRCKVEQTSSS